MATGEGSAFYRSNDAAIGGSVQANWADSRWSVGYAGAAARAKNYRGGDGAGPVDGRAYHLALLEIVGVEYVAVVPGARGVGRYLVRVVYVRVARHRVES